MNSYPKGAFMEWWSYFEVEFTRYFLKAFLSSLHLINGYL
jgi:hypothetical protein